MSPPRRYIGMYESQAFKALNLKAFRSFPLGQRAFQVLGRHGSFSKTSEAGHRKQKLIAEARITKPTKTTRTKHFSK
jgi:hypothetical protein